MRENVIVRHFMPRTIYVRGFSFAQKGEKTMKKINVRKLTGIAMLSAVAFALQFLEFPIPIIPSFIKLDFSDLPELIGAFAYGPAAGVIIALIKNLLHMTQSSSMYIGELSNFLMGAVLSLTAGLIYKHKKTKKGALIASLAASLLMGIASVPINYFIVYPLYYNVLRLPEQAVLDMYKALLPSTKSIFQALLIFNLPFTVCKGLICSVFSGIIYKPLSPLLHGKNN